MQFRLVEGWSHPCSILSDKSALARCTFESLGKDLNIFSSILDGCAFSVMENLGLALQHVQYNDIQRAIWVNAICINRATEMRRTTRYYGCVVSIQVLKVCLFGLGLGRNTTPNTAAHFTFSVYKP